MRRALGLSHSATSLAAALVAAALSGLLGCASPTDVAGGGGVETTGGDLVASAGGASSLAAGARVRLVPEGFIPGRDTLPDSLTVVADDTGHYAFKGLTGGRYNLEAFLPKTGERLLRRGLVLDGKARLLGRDTLKTPARLNLRWATAKPGHFYLPGTTWLRSMPVGETLPLEYLLDSVPAGISESFRHRPSLPDTAGSRVLTDSLEFQPGATVRFDVLDDWTHSARIILNTSPNGADVPGAVEDFPLLLRLFTGDFDFTQTAPGGRDLRFTDPDGSPLAHQIQRWDPASGRAEVWVRVPKADGASATDHILMYWGNPGAPDPKADPVFDQAGGFTALWHLDESGNTKPAGYSDELGLHPGTAALTIDSSRTEANIVGGLKLDGSKEVIVSRAPDLDSPPALTLSLWFKAENWAGGDRVLIQKGGGAGQYGLGDATDADSLEFRLSVENVLHTLRTPVPMTGELHQVHATFDGREARLYLDGVLRASAAIAGAISASSDNLYLGSKPGWAPGEPFEGLLDEVAIHHVARGADWIKFAYETQKQGSKVLRIEATK